MKSRSLLKSPTDNPQIQAALYLLRQAWDFAAERNQEAWEFAVPLRSFLSAGVNETELRWLADGGYIEHAHRVFQQVPNLTFSEKSCFVLTKKGRDVARKTSKNLGPKGSKSSEKATRTAQSTRPFWDETSHTLFWRGQPLKHYKPEAPNQEAIVRAFQDKHWQKYVTVPQEFEVNTKNRLHDAIKHLNRALRPYLRFHQERNGNRISWEALES
jgi:hypothetical protein